MFVDTPLFFFLFVDMLCGVALLVCANILWVDCCHLADENTVSCTFQLLFLFQVYSVLRWCVCSK